VRGWVWICSVYIASVRRLGETLQSKAAVPCDPTPARSRPSDRLRGGHVGQIKKSTDTFWIWFSNPILFKEDVHTPFTQRCSYSCRCDRLLKQILIDLCRFSTKFMQATERYSHSAHTTEQEILHKTANLKLKFRSIKNCDCFVY
jgi:hypothetical protein